MNFEDNQDLFLEEARELITKLETAFLQLEANPEREALIHDIFRALHTIKGSGAMFGFEVVAAFTHQVESLFDEVRKGLLPVSPELIALGLRSVDCIAGLLDKPDRTAEQIQLEADIQALGHKPVTVAVTVGPTTVDRSTAAPPSAAVGTGEGGRSYPRIYRIQIKPDRQILHRGVRLEGLLAELQEMGLYHCSADLDGVPDLSELNPTEIYLSWTITLSTDQPESAVRSVFLFVEDYAKITIEPLEVVGDDGEVKVPKLGEVLVARGLMDESTVDIVRQEQRPFGEVAVQSGIIKKSDLESALAEQQIVKSTSIEREVRQESSSIRVKKEKLDFLVDAVGELVILQARLSQEAKGHPLFEGISEGLARLTGTLRDSTMSIRMVPLEESFSSFQRLTRDLSKQLGKELFLEIKGASTELDKNIIESLKDPLVHIIRNSADHGIEAAEVRAKAGKPRTGTITISATQHGSNVHIEISDDGAGLNLDKIRSRGLERGLIDATETDRNKIMALIFEPGFSTAEKTTSLSGRGVGMDVVKTNIEKLRGEISISSETGRGTRIVLSIPLTLVIVDGLLVKVGGVDYVVTLSLVQECVDSGDHFAAGRPAKAIIHLRGKTIPVIDLSQKLIGAAGLHDENSRLVIVNVDGSEVALKVDAVIGKQQVVIKPFSVSMKKVAFVSGATILGDGSVGLILNINELVKASRKDSEI